ncbi:Serine/threonine protein phosphatase 7 long form isogeny [Arachis hypogaea]|nr:Serine/threonine protein phosphatase 7 long form isogeny [Arachis hypogaea]
MMTCDHPVPPDRYDERVEEHLRSTGFYHVSHIGVVQCQKALVNALVERWHPKTHTFHLLVGECAVSLEDVAMIFGFPTEGLPVIGMTLSSFEALEAECLHQFGVAPRKSDCQGSGIKLTWLRDLKERSQLTDENSIQVYVKCHIMLLIGTILFGDKSRTSVYWKYLPLLSDFASIGQYSWGSACLAHLWQNWERGDRVYRYHKLAHFRKALDELQKGQFCWVAYSAERVDPDIIPAEIYMHSVIWSATVPLVSFECIEWHATDRFRRQFGFVQRVLHQERSLDRAHGEVLTGPKNLNWTTVTTHSFWVMQWTNRYNHYRSKYGDHLNLSDLAVQEDVEGDQVMDDDNEEQEPQSPPPPTPHPPPPPAAEEQPHFTSQYVPQIQFPTSFPIHQPHFDSGEGGSFSQLLGFMASNAGQAQYSHQADFMAGRYLFDVRYPFYTYSGTSGGFVSGDSSRSDGGRGVLNSQNPNRVSMTMIEENAKTFEHETAEYLVDEPDDEEDDKDEDEDMDEEDDEDMDQDEESRNDAGDTCTPGETGKGYNLRIDLPRRSASRYTPSVIKKTVKKCKNIVNFGKWTVRK